MKEINFQSLEQALAHCSDIQQKGKEPYFRGQTGLWSMKTTLARIVEDELDDKAKQKITNFRLFLEQTPELSHIKDNTNAFYAVAQHYGLPTNYLDFSTDHEIAFFFATHASKALESGHKCCIIYFEKDAFLKNTKALQESGFIETEPDLYPELVSIDVSNLWRLQAQKGHFIYSPYINFEDFYSCFTKVIFPYEKPYEKYTTDQIYPKEKSRLEILLDQYFFNEDKRKRIKWAKQFMEDTKMKQFHFKVDNHEIPQHPTWKDRTTHVIDEHWTDSQVRSDIFLELEIEDSQEAIRAQLDKVLSKIKRSKNYAWTISSNSLTKTDRISQWVQIFWEGTRNMTYTHDQLLDGLTSLIYWAQHLDSLKEFSSMNWTKTLGEISGQTYYTMEARTHNKSYKRLASSQDSLLHCLRDDIFDLLKEVRNVPDIFLKNNRPRQLFDRKKFEDVFIREYIPLQIVMSYNDMYLFNIDNLEAFGLA